jgi:hypothetical protein
MLSTRCQHRGRRYCGARSPRISWTLDPRAPHLAQRAKARLHDWLLGYRVTHVAMEATGEQSFELVLANAMHIKNVPGRRPTLMMRCGSRICWHTV